MGPVLADEGGRGLNLVSDLYPEFVCLMTRQRLPVDTLMTPPNAFWNVHSDTWQPMSGDCGSECCGSVPLDLLSECSCCLP